MALCLPCGRPLGAPFVDYAPGVHGHQKGEPCKPTCALATHYACLAQARQATLTCAACGARRPADLRQTCPGCGRVSAGSVA